MGQKWTINNTTLKGLKVGAIVAAINRLIHNYRAYFLKNIPVGKNE